MELRLISFFSDRRIQICVSMKYSFIRLKCQRQAIRVSDAKGQKCQRCSSWVWLQGVKCSS